MSLASIAAIALLSTAAVADGPVEKSPTQTRAVASSDQAGTRSAKVSGEAAAPAASPQYSSAQPVDPSNTAVVEARPSTPGEEGIWYAAP